MFNININGDDDDNEGNASKEAEKQFATNNLFSILQNDDNQQSIQPIMIQEGNEPSEFIRLLTSSPRL